MISKLVGRLSKRRQSEDGSALILALLMVTVIGIIMGAVISFADTGLLAAPQLRDLRNQNNYAQGALDGAINSIRGSSVSGTFGTNFPCPSFTAPSAYSPGGAGDTSDPVRGVYDPSAPTNTTLSPSFKVSCQGRDASQSAPTDQPLFAVLTLGSAPDGLTQANDGGNHQLAVDGGVYSNGNITVESGGGNGHNNMYVTGSVFAEGTCTSSLITSTDRSGPNGGLYCPNYNDTNHIGDDPLYPLGIKNQGQLTSLIGSDTDLTTGADPVPTCSTRSDVTEFQPGYYSVTPRALVDALAPTCSGSIYLFNPGKYFFDYNGMWDLGSPSSVSVIGGTPTGWFAGGSQPTLGSACQKGQSGVQFEFGGLSRVQVTSSGGIELCGPTSSEASSTFNTAQRIALSTMPAGGGSSPNTSQSTTPVTNGHFQAVAAPNRGPSGALWTLPLSDAQQIDGQSASASLSSTSNNPDPLLATAVLNYDGTSSAGAFQPVPKGSRITSVNVRVKQRTNNIDTAQLTVRTPYTDTLSHPPTYDAMANSCEGGGGCDLNIPIPLTDISTAARPSWRDIDNLSLSYKATVKNPTGTQTIVNGSVAMNGIELIVSYVPPALEKLDNSLTGSSSPAFLNSTVNLNTFFHGTVYTPNAFLDVNVNNRSGTIFDRGVIARSLKVHVSASSKQTDPPFSLPTSIRGSRLVIFNACINGHRRARALVEYTDKFTPSGASENLAYPGYRVVIKRWSVLRADDGQGPACPP